MTPEAGPAPTSTGPGPMPGTDPREAARVVMGECHSLPFLPELPDRGPGADAIGRTLATLAASGEADQRDRGRQPQPGRQRVGAGRRRGQHGDHSRATLSGRPGQAARPSGSAPSTS